MSKKTCKMTNCNYPLFARGYCKYHYNSEYLAKKEKKKVDYKIPKRTPKRIKQEAHYRDRRKKFIEISRDCKGKLWCIFSVTKFASLG